MHIHATLKAKKAHAYISLIS